MGPKKEISKKENDKACSVDDPLNTDTWKCIVVMAVERTHDDCFILKEFMDAASSNQRSEVKVINFDNFVLKIINDFANGLLAFKYSFLLNFSAIFMEASEYVKNKSEIPVFLLVKAVKALLFLLKEQSLQDIQKKSSEGKDLIKAMSERPADVTVFASKNSKVGVGKKEQPSPGKGKKTESILFSIPKVRPASISKEDTKLLKRGEGAKDGKYIDDCPIDSYFNLYVLLSGFYQPDFALELIKGGVPLHGFLCIDTSQLGVKQTFATNTFKTSSLKIVDKQHFKQFWDSFLKMLWDPVLNYYFKETIFQVYTPKKLNCGKKLLKEIIYREISFLLYDMSDYMTLHINYLNNLKLWDVNEKEKVEIYEKYEEELDDFPCESVKVPVVLYFILNSISGDQKRNFYDQRTSDDSTDLDLSQCGSIDSFCSKSVIAKNGSSTKSKIWSQIVSRSENENNVTLYLKLKELDLKYHLTVNFLDSSAIETSSNEFERKNLCRGQNDSFPAENIEEALHYEDGIFRSYWRKFETDLRPQEGFFPPALDYCLYSILLARVICPFMKTEPQAKPSLESIELRKKNSSFQLIENFQEEMKKPHFTVTDCCRSVLRCVPCNVKDKNRDFFSPDQYKIVPPNKVKANSAPEFRIQPCLLNEASFVSEIIPSNSFYQNVRFNVYENLKNIVGKEIFLLAEGFDFVEELSKTKLLSKENEFWDEYNCIDYSYSVLNDSLLVVLHNRLDSDNALHEVFNTYLKTLIGLRDFFDFIIEDVPSSLSFKDKIQNNGSLFRISDSKNSLTKEFQESDFWMENSIKYAEFIKTGNHLNSRKQEEVRNAKSSEKEAKPPSEVVTEKPDEKPKENGSSMVGFNVDEIIVQFSGLKTVYYVQGSVMTVELMERLYGDQNLGIHLQQGGHVLHLYSYVCPIPRLIYPYTCHITYKNGIIAALGKRYIGERFGESDGGRDVTDSNSSVASFKIASKAFSSAGKDVYTSGQKIEDEAFVYDLKLSLPNGLMVETVRKHVFPCYIKQYYLTQSEPSIQSIKMEKARLFLPNGSIIKMMNDGTVQVFKGDTSIVKTILNDINAEYCSNESTPGNSEEVESSMEDVVILSENFETISASGQMFNVMDSKIVSSRKLQLLQNTDVESKLVYFRREDGTNYILGDDGTLCVEFNDGTKISTTPFIQDEAYFSSLDETSKSDEELTNNPKYAESLVDKDNLINCEIDFVFVHFKVIIENPFYMTVIYNSNSETWNILLPYDSVITVESTGNYSIEIDDQTKFRIDRDTIEMNRYSCDHTLQSSMTSDLSVFRKNVSSGGIYCKLMDFTGKTCIVESNSRSYTFSSGNVINNCFNSKDQNLPKSPKETGKTENVNLSEEKEVEMKLSTNKKYFVVRRDISGLELMHKDEVKEVLTKPSPGSIIYTQEIPELQNLRCFILITPYQKTKTAKWGVESILPSPKFKPNRGTRKISSTYGFPPSWMHPYPKSKIKFQIPENFASRVFIETNKTEIIPTMGSFECTFCQMDFVVDEEILKVQPGFLNIQNYFKKLANEDQNLLKNMYLSVAEKIINKIKPSNTEKLKCYLALSKKEVQLSEYHKRSIRYHSVPNYFDHPAGMSWLLLNNLINKLGLSTVLNEKQVSSVTYTSSTPKSLSSAFSNEEIEYNLEAVSNRSFSSLSYRSGISMATAPPVLRKGNTCFCKIQPNRSIASAPPCAMITTLKSEEDLLEPQQRLCSFKDFELKMLKANLFPSEKSIPLHLEELAYLGLI